MTSAKGVDGEVVLAALLDRLSETSAAAAAAPRGKGLTGYLSAGLNQEDVNDADAPYSRLVRTLIEDLSIWWSPVGFSVIPTMVPWCIRDRSARYDQGPESWGAPRSDGYFRDDNSIIKKLPLTLTISAPQNSMYDGQKPWRGFTACHIWREMESGNLGGVDPWVYSFMPNLVWLPRPLAGLTDHHTRIKALLGSASLSIFRSSAVSPSVRPWTDYVWGQIGQQVPPLGWALRTDALSTFQVDMKFVQRRTATMLQFADGARAVVEGRTPSRKIVSSRYTSGITAIRTEKLLAFEESLTQYASAVTEAAGSRTALLN